MNKYSVVVIKGILQWRYRIQSENGRILSVSQRYYSKSNTVRAAKRVAKEFGWNYKEEL